MLGLTLGSSRLDPTGSSSPNSHSTSSSILPTTAAPRTVEGAETRGFCVSSDDDNNAAEGSSLTPSTCAHEALYAPVKSHVMGANGQPGYPPIAAPCTSTNREHPAAPHMKRSRTRHTAPHMAWMPRRRGLGFFLLMVDIVEEKRSGEMKREVFGGTRTMGP